jgi:hypothetical protein
MIYKLPLWEYIIAEEISHDEWQEIEGFRVFKYSHAEKNLLNLRKANPDKKLDILKIVTERMRL